ncbi:MAG: tetratricopeptide repeat protein [Deltaproteobacteria bacterium]|nr:tetratricopeptide repeat protein [Deltaproteobacteria bacterium]
MSYIHQALKKAQTERDDRYGKYEGILSSRSRKPGIGRWIVIAVAALVILFLAFISYSWLDLSGPGVTTAGPAKPNRPGPAPVRKKAADAEAFYQIGKTHHKSGRLNQAKIFYEKALKADPGCVVALNNLGVILMREGNTPAARSRFEKAIRLKPGYVDPCYNLACLFALTDQTEQGLRYLKRAVSLDPQVKAWAMEDADLEKLRDQPGFKDIVK